MSLFLGGFGINVEMFCCVGVVCMYVVRRPFLLALRKHDGCYVNVLTARGRRADRDGSRRRGAPKRLYRKVDSRRRGIRRESMIVMIGLSGEEGECEDNNNNNNAGDRRRKDESLENG